MFCFILLWCICPHQQINCYVLSTVVVVVDAAHSITGQFIFHILLLLIIIIIELACLLSIDCLVVVVVPSLSAGLLAIMSTITVADYYVSILTRVTITRSIITINCVTITQSIIIIHYWSSHTNRSMPHNIWASISRYFIKLLSM
jgi:hypothetical protein